MRTSLIFCAAIPAALFLSSCGKQESVEEVPSSEELAEKADAASKAIRDEEAGADASAIDTSQMASYTNALRGFTLLVPKDWTVDEASSDDNGSMFTDPEAGIVLSTVWTENREDADLLATVKNLEEAGDVTGAVASDQVKRDGWHDEGVLAVSVVQKAREIGILRATGTSTGKVVRVFLIQGGLLGVGGAIVGIGIGTLLALFFANLAQNPDGSPTFPVALTPQLFARALLTAVIVGILSAALPARRAARLDPADAIRNG